MSLGMSDYLEQQILTHVLRGGTFVKPTVIAIALCSGVPVDSNTGATIPEIPNANGYVRQTLNPSDTNWAAVSQINDSGNSNNLVGVVFPPANPAGWPTISGIAILDSATYGQGNLLYYGQAGLIKTPGINDQYQLPAGSINVYMD